MRAPPAHRRDIVFDFSKGSCAKITPVRASSRYANERSRVARGASGHIDIAIDKKTSEYVALKVVQRTPYNAKSLAMEELIHTTVTSVPHPNIVTLHETLHADSRKVVFVMEYCSGGDLLDLIPPDEGMLHDVAVDYARQLFTGLAHIHSKGFAHRDIKGENCVLTSDKKTLKIIDFGYSVRLGNQCAAACTSGTIPYIAPEAFTGASKDLSKCDIWAAGIVLYSMLTGRFPWGKAAVGDAEFSLFLAGTHSENEVSRWAAIQPELVDLLYSLLALNPDDRPTASKAVQRLNAVAKIRAASQGA